jgi:hypothetical protein
MKNLLLLLLLFVSFECFSQSTTKNEVVKNASGVFVVRVTTIQEYPCDTTLIRNLDEAISKKTKERDVATEARTKEILENTQLRDQIKAVLPKSAITPQPKKN